MADNKPDNLKDKSDTEKGYHDKSVQERMNRPTPEQQRTGGRSGGEDLASETPIDKTANPTGGQR